MKTIVLWGLSLASFLFAFPAFALSPGDLIINEVMANPSGQEPDGEWIEIYNPGLMDIDLQGLTLMDNNGSHVIASSVVVPAQGYAVLVNNENFEINGGLIGADYEYGDDLILSNGGDLVRLAEGSTMISGMNYGSSINGRSRALRCALLDTVSANYSSTPTDQTFGDGDAGTPGFYNDFGADSDDDGLGDSCDPCVGDADNDADLDGLCGGVFPGDLVITEVQPDPSVVADSQGEWFELHNASNVDLSLLGLTITDGEGSHQILDDVVIAAGGYALLAVSDPLIVPGGPVAVDYVYPYCTGSGCNGMALANSRDNIDVLADTIMPSGQVGFELITSMSYREPPNNRGEAYALPCPDSVDYELTRDITPGYVNGVDSDFDGIADACDSCPFDPDNDADGDGLCADVDLCLGTVSDNPPRLNPNHFVLRDVAGGDFMTESRGRGNGPGRSYTIDDTAGCSCFQIVDELGLGGGLRATGCSIGVMDGWVRLVSE